MQYLDTKAIYQLDMFPRQYHNVYFHFSKENQANLIFFMITKCFIFKSIGQTKVFLSHYRSSNLKQVSHNIFSRASTYSSTNLIFIIKAEITSKTSHQKSINNVCHLFSIDVVLFIILNFVKNMNNICFFFFY